MRLSPNRIAALLALAATTFAQTPATGELKAKVEAKMKQLQSWSTDPGMVAAVKDYNANPPADAKGMTNAKWKELSILDPFVRSYTKNPLAVALKARKDDIVSECFVSGADGAKVAFLAKTTSWSHAGKDKHMVPMTGKPWIGPVEVDESTGQQQVQVGLPVLDGGKPIGSVVFGLAVSKLK